MWMKIQKMENYSVNEKGEVRSNKTGKILKQYTDPDGYLMVSLHNGNVRRYVGVHRLVAEAFVANPEGLPIVNHKDECKTNNVPENLEWCDASYSTNYGARNRKTGRANSKWVYQYENGELVGVWLGTKTAGQVMAINPTKISDCARGQKKTAGGYTWSYTLIPE